MKKVIFISALAIAAAVSCTKSDIVDTKFDDAIGFTTYLGRDAQTKAAVTTTANLAQFGVYGFYTATVEYNPNTHTTANLMDKVVVSGSVESGWTYSPAKYWTNGTDMYTFFAYAPVTVAPEAAEGVTGVEAPYISYTVPRTLKDQADVIYSVNNRNVTKDGCTDTENSTTFVPFTFKHALARLSVKAKAVMYRADGSEVTADKPLGEGEVADNTFTITNITIKGKFCETGKMDLSTPYTKDEAGNITGGGPVWAATPSTDDVVYDLTATTGQLLNDKYYDFSATEEKNYLMILPVDFSQNTGTVEKPVYPNAATLTVTYKVTYAGETSEEISKTVLVPINFQQGKAYTINLTLQRDEANAIQFTVEQVEGWEAVTPEQDSTIKA